MIPAGTPDIVEAETKIAAERVLIVEDDAAARVGLEQLLRSWGFIAESACDGEEALEKVTSFRPAIVITDMVMPRMDGLALLRALPQVGADVTTLLLTAQGTVDTAVEAMRNGARSFVQKPWEDVTLLEILQREIEESQATKRSDAKQKREFEEARLIQRDQFPEDIVGAVAFFCSPDADFITGQSLVVDGGAYFN